MLMLLCQTVANATFINISYTFQWNPPAGGTPWNPLPPTEPVDPTPPAPWDLGFRLMNSNETVSAGLTFHDYNGDGHSVIDDEYHYIHKADAPSYDLDWDAMEAGFVNHTWDKASASIDEITKFNPQPTWKNLATYTMGEIVLKVRNPYYYGNPGVIRKPVFSVNISGDGVFGIPEPDGLSILLIGLWIVWSASVLTRRNNYENND